MLLALTACNKKELTIKEIHRTQCEHDDTPLNHKSEYNMGSIIYKNIFKKNKELTVTVNGKEYTGVYKYTNKYNHMDYKCDEYEGQYCCFEIDVNTKRIVCFDGMIKRGMIFTTDEGCEYKFEQPGLNIWRDRLDYWLTQKAVESGAELRQNTSFISCEDKRGYVEVQLKGESSFVEKCKLLIACDGAVSIVKRQILGTPKNYIITYQNFCRGKIDLDYHYFYAYLQPHLSEYDAWFNVKDDYLIFGVDADFLRDALDIEERSRIEIEGNNMLMIVNVPVMEDVRLTRSCSRCHASLRRRNPQLWSEPHRQRRHHPAGNCCHT